ncbi:MAG: 50S ribosomal protein L9 [Paracoccaceae bacterium]|nr:50S ribosomal protein L9 [Paracoccaceae bacterium]MDE2674688.1 50S ribosomal protein L9 [Paracoccaceae bacterium]MXZ50532.1 50S ribosomal protein L9 [Paracoccaceae bacterium]MYF45629.1 50S ribosomal protein L9 [Paracoccaceae bacterium]MYG09576.1 50S ribosomal protein L9 [Paracoccaceae bacterium]
MELILLEKVNNLGLMGDLVRVKPGYARNYLLPQKKALKNTEENRKYFEDKRVEIEARNLELRNEAQEVSEKIDGQSFIVIRSASETGSLYGSVTKRDIATAATESGLSIDRKQIELNRPFKEIGIYQVKVNLHPEVETSIYINIARTVEEAEAQTDAGEEETGEALVETLQATEEAETDVPEEVEVEQVETSEEEVEEKE